MTEIRNPAKLPTNLNPTEKKFVRCLAAGEFCIVGSGELPKKGIESGEGANLVRSEVIRFFAHGGNEENPVLGPLICLRGAWVSGGLNLMHVSIPYALLFHNCHFDAVVGMAHTKCTALYLNGSRLMQGLFADGLTTKGDVNLCAGFSAEDGVQLLNANIGGNLNCGGGKFNNSGGKALVADRLTTKGSVFLRMISAKGEVRLLGASIGGDLDCDDGKFHNPKRDALSASKSIVEGDVYLRKGFSVEGTVRMSGASIGGDFDCVGGKFHNPDGDALHADAFKVKGCVYLQDGFSASGDVRLLNANIGGDLSCTWGTFHNPGKNALSADKSTVKGDVNLIYGFSAEGEVRLIGVNIGGNLNCVEGKFNNPKGSALNIDSGNIGGNLLWWKTTCKGSVILTYAKANVLSDDANSWESCKVDLEGFTYNRFFGPVDAPFRIHWLSKRPDKVPFSPLPYEQTAKVLRAAGKDIDVWDIEREKRELQRTERHPSNSFKISRWGRLWGRAIDALTDFIYRPWKTLGWAIVIVCASALLFNFADKHGRIVPHQPLVLANMDYQTEVFPRCVEFQCPSKRRPTTVVRRLFPDYPQFSPLAFSLDVFIPFFSLHQELFWAPASGDGNTFWMLLFPPMLFMIFLGVVMFFAWLFRHWRRSRKGGVFTASAAVGMAVVSLEIAIAAATGIAHILYGAESVLWLVGGQRLTIWYWLEIGAGWILTSLFLLSITGLLRPRQSSGEKD